MTIGTPSDWNSKMLKLKDVMMGCEGCAHVEMETSVQSGAKCVFSEELRLALKR